MMIQWWMGFQNNIVTLFMIYTFPIMNPSNKQSTEITPITSKLNPWIKHKNRA